MNNIFFYDGDCVFCTNLAERLKKNCLDSKISFKSFRDYSAQELSTLHPELTMEKLESEIQFLYNGKRYPGFFAIRALSPKLKLWRYLFPILYLPLIPFIGMGFMYILKRTKLS